MKPDETIYAVWGPTAEWGDGSGPLGYFSSRTDAETFIAEERVTTTEAEMLSSWPYNIVDYSIEETSARELGVPIEMFALDEDAFFEAVNTR